MSEKSEAAERFETWGGSSYTKAKRISLLKFPTLSFSSPLAQANLFAILTLSSAPVIEL